MWVRFLGWEDFLEEGMVTHSSILAWRIPGTERSLAGYSTGGRKESDTTEATEHTQTLLKLWPGAVSSVRGSSLTPCFMVFLRLLKFRT